MVSWEFFCKRRGLSIGSVIESFGLKNYEDLQNYCKARSVRSPEKDEFKSYLAAKKANVKKPDEKKPTPVPAQKQPAAEPVKKKPSPRRRTRKKQE